MQTRKSLFIAVFCAFAFLIGTNAFCADVAKLGFVNVQRVMEISTAGKEASSVMKTEGEKMEAELQIKEAEIEELKKTLDRKAMVMKKEAREESERELRIKINDFKTMNKRYMDQFKRLEKKLVNKLKDEIFAIVEEIGQAEGFLLVLEKNEGGVIYAPTTVDLTDRVVQLYNERYAANK